MAHCTLQLVEGWECYTDRVQTVERSRTADSGIANNSRKSTLSMWRPQATRVEKQRAIAAGKIANLELSAIEVFDQDSGPTSKAKAKGISGGGSRSRKGEVRTKLRPRYCANCQRRQTFDVTVCQDCGYPLTAIAKRSREERERQPRCFRILPALGAFLEKSKELSKRRGEKPVFWHR